MMSLSTKSVGLRVLAPLLLLLGQSCTSLTETPHDALTPDNAFKTDAEILAGVAGVYANLRNLEWVGPIVLADITADMSIVPTRGSDWYDNGRWLEMHRQTWTANSGSALDDMNGSWNNLFAGIAKANLMIDVITKAGSGAKGDSTLAELRTLRAYHYYLLQDMFGGVPLATSTALQQLPRVTRDSVYRFLVSELLAARANLPNTRPSSDYGRVTKGVANAILASLYLNAGVYNKDNGVSPSAYNTCGTACQPAIDAANAVINSGAYTLNPNWFQNFSADNKSSPENIFTVVHSKDQGLGGNWPMRTLHYNQLNTGWGSPWNGFATLAETYNAFSPTDERKGMWLAGQAYSFETKQAVNDRTNKPLIFTVNIVDVSKASEGDGVRFNKFPPTPSALSGNGHPNDFTLFRLAEMYLIRAEAENELGQTGPAIADLAIIHDRHESNPAKQVASMGLTTQQQIRDAILNERLLEFAAEGKRRTDLVRHGKYLTWTEASLGGVCGAGGSAAGCPARSSNRILFPIPSTQLQANSLLTQNPGY